MTIDMLMDFLIATASLAVGGFVGFAIVPLRSQIIAMRAARKRKEARLDTLIKNLDKLQNDLPPSEEKSPE